MNPQLFGKYQLIKKLATGGMAEVWLARQRGIEGFAKNVVVKRILPHLAEDAEFVEMFRNEALIAAKFNHPNIAQVYEFGEANGTYFIAMEYIHGEDLGRVLRKAYNAGGWIAQPLAIRIVAAACEGLYYAHTRTDDAGRPLKVVHRDISPQNILISFDGSVKLVDFGIAKAADQASMTKSGAIKGKFAYMAPEQAAGKPLDSRADIFAIGLVLYEMLTSNRPLKRDMELATLQAALECNILPPSQVADVPPELDAVVMRALAKAADDRYRDARQLQLALEEFLVSQRWVAGSVQISELMEALFADRLEEERRSGNPEPRGEESATAVPAAPEFPTESPAAPSSPPRSTSRTMPRAAASPPPSPEMDWEAPPGEMQPPPRRTSMRTPANKRTESNTAPMPAEPEAEEWEAPPSTEVASRRRAPSESIRRSVPSSPSMARAPSRQDAVRGTPTEMPSARRPISDVAIPRRSGSRVGEPAVEPEVRRSSPALAIPPRVRTPSEEDPERTILPPPEPEPVRRRTGSQPAAVAPAEPAVRRRTVIRPEVAEPAPVRRRTSSVPKARAVVDDEDSVPDAQAGVEAPERKRGLPLPKLLAGVAAVALVGAGLAFHKPLLEVLGSTAMDGQGIYISLETSIPVEVSVKHSARCGSSSPITSLGNTPLRDVSGAHLQDTLILENKQLGIFKQLEVPFGEPNEHKQLPPVEFKTGKVRLKLLPANSKISGVEIFRDGQKLGLYSPNLALELVEGEHHLILQGTSLKEPVQVDVEVKGRDTTEKVVNVTEFLQQ
ncbi:serine/threonine protein kinase [Cystobacter ferrugineus]|uniref:Protein kinase n=1 Tax=Cystobacter ferrugineus TaxID=83449 RepID=A0A1L9BB73_9BACT|nr:serine/threonine-protein kinase [Cystobacter ferrugineus]OJH39517.1 protein kinase [Cystobacter ferrugineus]